MRGSRDLDKLCFARENILEECHMERWQSAGTTCWLYGWGISCPERLHVCPGPLDWPMSDLDQIFSGQTSPGPLYPSQPATLPPLLEWSQPQLLNSFWPATFYSECSRLITEDVGQSGLRKLQFSFILIKQWVLSSGLKASLLLTCVCVCVCVCVCAPVYTHLSFHVLVYSAGLNTCIYWLHTC